MKKALSLLLCGIMACTLLVGCGGSTSESTTTEEKTEEKAEETAEPIVWNFVSAFSKDAAEHDGFWVFVDRINNELGDRLQINYLGGTEIVAYFDQFEQLGKGTFDIGHIPVNMAENIVPATDAYYLTELTAPEMRESGAYDKMCEYYTDLANVQFLGVTGGRDYGYTLYTNFEVNSLEDFKGKTIRTAPVFVPLLEALGAGSVSISGGELYTSLERGVVDGYGWSTVGAVDNAWYEVSDNMILPIFYPCNVGMYVNQDSFNALPEDLQAEVLRIAEEVEASCYDMYGDLVDTEIATLKEKGMNIIELDGELKEEWLTTSREAGWANLEKLDADAAAAMKPLVTK